jgi:tetratricopeptide (TPR) repeat protein
MKMRKIKLLVFALVAGTMFISCSKRIIPGLKPGKTGKEYDLAGFDYLYVEAIKQKLMGNNGDALKYFEQCIIIDPENDASYYQMAQIVLNNGDLINGKKYIKRANVIQPGNLWYNMLLAGIYNQQNNIDSAIICYERAAKAYPDKEDLQISLARLYTQNKNFDKAKNILNRFDNKYGVNEKTTLSLIENLLAEGKGKDALGKIHELLAQKPDDIVYNGYLAQVYRSEGENQKAKDVYKQLIGRNPENPGIQLSLCDFLLSEKSYDELFDLLNVVFINQKITREEKISLTSELITKEDIIKNNSKKMELAIMILEANYKDDDIIVLLRPEFLQNEKKTEEAASRLEEIIKIRPENYYAWEKLLMLYYDMKDFSRPEKRGEECATRFNRSIIAKILYASGAMENGNFNVALEELRKADILAGDSKVMKLQIQTLRADIYYRMKNYNEAFKAYDEALKLDDSDLTVMNNYAYYLAEQNLNLREAEKMAKVVTEKEKGNVTFLDTYAWVLFKRGKTRDALKIMEKVVNSEDNEDAEYYEHYGFILKKLGKCQEAVKSWERAISLDESKTNLKKEIENCGK